MRRIHADLLLLAAAAIWAIAFLFQKSAMAHVGPLAFVAARGFVASLALAPLAMREGLKAGRLIEPSVLKAALAVGAAFFLGSFLQQAGLVTATVTNSSFLTALYVVITPVLVWALMGRRPAPLVWFAVALSFLGTWLLGGGTFGAFSLGDGLVALSAVFWALHMVLLGRAAQNGRPILLTSLQFLVVGLLGLVCALRFETVSLAALRAASIEIAYVGLLSSALTFTIFTLALCHTSPSEAAIIVSTETVFAALAAYLALGERLSWLGWTGAGLIFGAVLIVQLAPGIGARGSGQAAAEPEKS